MGSSNHGENGRSSATSLGLQSITRLQVTTRNIPPQTGMASPQRIIADQQNRQDSHPLDTTSAPSAKGPRPWKIEDDSNFWQTYIDEAEDYDDDMVDGWNRALENLLLFSGLFSAVNTAFIIETYKKLQPDPMEPAVHLLKLILRHRNDTDQFTDSELEPMTRRPERSAINMNNVFFSSLSCSLLVALGAVLAKDWLTQYDHRGLTSKPLSVQARMRQKKLEGLERWHFRLLMYSLPLLLQASLALFFVGLIMFLWEICNEVAMVVSMFFSAGSLAYIATWIMAIPHPSCPFQTPISRFLRRAGVYTAKTIGRSSISTWMRRTGGRLSKCTWWYRSKIAPIFTSIKVFLKESAAILFQTMEDESKGGLAWEVEKSKDPLNAECVGWLYEQAERREVIQQTLVVAPLLPPHLVLQAFNKRVGLVHRLTTRYNSHVENLVGKQKRVLRPGDAIISGIALFHLLKATLKDSSTSGPKRILSEYRIRNIGDCELGKGRKDQPVYKVLSMVLYCVEMLQPISKNFKIEWFKDFMEEAFKKDGDKLCSTIKVSDSLVISVTHSELFLDAVIACCARRCVWPESSIYYYDRCDLEAVLEHFETVLRGPDRPADQVISQIAIAIVAIQLSKVFDPSSIIHRNLLDWMLSAWYVVDKRKTVFINIVLALDASQSIDSTQNMKPILFLLLRFLGDFLPRDMETSNKSEKWRLWWPEAMKLFPGVLKLLQPLPNEEEVPLETIKDVLNMFARLLPDDLQYEDIQESFASTRSEKEFPQLYILNPCRDINSEDPFKWILHYLSRTTEEPPEAPVEDLGEPQPVSTLITDSVVELLGWIVAYPCAISSICNRIEGHKEYLAVPSFLFSVLESKTTQLNSLDEKEKENPGDEQKKARMICRHAVRHLSALARMKPKMEGVAMGVKRRVLLLMLEKWDTLSSWSEWWPIGEQPLQHLKEGFQEFGSNWRSWFCCGQRSTPSDDANAVTNNRVRVWAFQELILEWKRVSHDPSMAQSPGQDFFFEGSTVAEIVKCLKSPESLPDFVPDSLTYNNLCGYFDGVENQKPAREEIGEIRKSLHTYWLTSFWGKLSHPGQWFHPSSRHNQPPESA